MKKTILDQGWTLRLLRAPEGCPLLEGSSWDIPAMPMEVADVLVHSGAIDLPWRRGRAAEYQFLSQCDWLYETAFPAPGGDGEISLEFLGLDLFAAVSLNGRELARHENAFLPLEVPIPSDLLREENHLEIRLFSTSRVLVERTAHLPPETSLHRRAQELNLRKNLNDFTEYLGQKPCFVRMGVFGGVSLVEPGAGRLEEASLDAQVTADLSQGLLSLSCSGRLTGSGTLALWVTDPQGEEAASLEEPLEGDFERELSLTLPAPRLWYPRGYGDQAMYTVTAELRTPEGTALDRRVFSTGFRRLEMPRPMHFRINGIDVRLYGGNWAPQSAVTECWDEEDARRKLRLAVFGNYNALRVWGCGSPVPESFYREADRLGILIWQDFYLVYTGPRPEGRRENLLEAGRLIRRLRHHPGLFLWCGGNESLSFYYWSHNGEKMPGREVLEEELKDLCHNEDPGRFYLPESPYGGYDYNDPRVWDTHCYTNYSYVPGYAYLNFASEDFRISAPPLRSCLKFMDPQDLWPEDYRQIHLPGDLCEVPDPWLKFNAGFESDLKYGPLWNYYDAHDGESMIHRVNIAASEFYRRSIERLRRGRPSGSPGGERCCGGYLVWKFNESWPQIYGAKVDFFGEPTMPFYFIKRAYDPVQVSFDVGNFIHAWVVNDTTVPVSGRLELGLYHITENRWEKRITHYVSVAPGESLDAADLTEDFGTFRRQNILTARLVDNLGQVLARATQTVGVERYTRFPRAALSLSWAGDGALLVASDQYAHCVYLEGDEGGDEFGWLFEDNYFSLLPGEVKRVKLLGRHHSGTVRAREFYSGIVTELTL